MADLLKINQDAMKVVQLSEMALGKASEWKLDTITYEIRDKDSKIVAEYEGRENQEAAQADADNRNFAEDIGQPFHVTQRSNLSVDEKGNLDFEVGSSIGIQFPFEAIDAAADQLNNAIDCEAIEEMIKDEIKRVQEMLEAKTSKMGELSPFGDLMKLPSNPLKILSWAKKFVSMYLGPQVLAMIDLAMQIALTAQAITKIITAANAAQQNLRLCAVSIVDNALEAAIEGAEDLVNKAVPGLDGLLTEINDIQTTISDITGKPPIFDVSNGVSGLIESATTENKAKFMSEVTEFALRPLNHPDTIAAEERQLEAAADEMNAALGLPPRGSSVPGIVTINIDGTDFTFQNGVMVQASGTNSGTGTGISTNSQKSLTSMDSAIGTEWDGTVPSYVTMIDKLDGVNLYSNNIPHGDIGPFGTPNMPTGGTKKVLTPKNNTISCFKFNLRNDRGGFGFGQYNFEDGSGQNNHWKEQGLHNSTTEGLQMIAWFSDTPGGAARTNMFGEPIIENVSLSQRITIIQAYDISLLTNSDHYYSPQDGGQAGVLRYYTGVDGNVEIGDPFYVDAWRRRRSVLFPIVTKTYFFNVALVNTSQVQNFVDTGTIPTPSQLQKYVPDQTYLSDEDYQYYLDSVPYQWRVFQGQIQGNYGVSLSDYLEAALHRTDSTNTLYNGTDNTMEPFIGSTWGGSYPSDTQLITNWQYLDGTSVGGNTDIGFTSSIPLSLSGDSSDPTPARKYPIPTNGKISTSEFSVGWGGKELGTKPGIFSSSYPDRLETLAFFFDRNNSTFDITWDANLDSDNSRAWYDLDLMPVAWMSDEPGGSPKTLVDGSTGVVIKLEKTGATYKGQQLLSTTKSQGSDRATLPILQKKFFLNVAVVSESTATSLVASGTAPTAAQRVSWSPTDASLPYTGSSDQHLKVSLTNRTTDKSDYAIHN